MALSYNLGYQESISVHPTRRQNFAGKVYSNFPNIWEWLIYLWTLKLAFQLRSPNLSIPNQILTLRKPIAYPLIGKIKKVEGALTWATSNAISKSLYENSLWKTLNKCHGSPGMSPNGESNFPQLELGQEPITCPLHVFASGNINN